MTDIALPLKMPTTTADHLLGMLREHYLREYRLPEGIFAPEIGAPDGNRRADLIWQGVTSRRRELVGHEIKVSRADLKHELDHPEKSWPWKQYSDRWWLVVPHTQIIDGFDIPADWGIMLPPSGRRTRSMTILCEAPKLRPVTQDPALRTLATWLFWRNHEAANEVRQHRREAASWNARIEHLSSEIERYKQALAHYRIEMHP